MFITTTWQYDLRTIRRPVRRWLHSDHRAINKKFHVSEKRRFKIRNLKKIVMVVAQDSTTINKVCEPD